MTVPENILTAQKIDTGAYVKAEFEISAKMAFRVYDEISSYKINENGNFLCELLLPDINTICNYASSFGEYCTIILPDEAAHEMKRRLENSLKNYL